MATPNPIPARLARFQRNWAKEFKTFLNTPCGVAVLAELQFMSPKPMCEPIEHQAVYRLGSIAGHQQALADLYTLSDVRPDPQPAPSLNYGVKEKVDLDELSEK